MSKEAQGPGMAGFALAEVLVAALLLALALLGAAGSLVEALHAQHAALLRTRAADLAADLAETLRPAALADPAAQEISRQEIALWRSQVQRALPSAQAQVQARTQGSGAIWAIGLQWRETRSGRTSTLQLPVASNTAGSAP